MDIFKVSDYDAMSDKACDFLIELLQSLKEPVLGLATGSTPEGLYDRLIEKHTNAEVSFQHSTTFNLDEYVGLAKDDPNSYHYYMHEKLFRHIDIPEDKAHVPLGDAEDLEAECRRYEEVIRSAGKADVQLLGLGVNGHIAFNEPGTSFASRTHVVDLVESTRQANARFFASMDDVPTKAITMGMETIMESREILLLASGEKKADAVAHLVNGKVTEDFPASILQNHPYVTIIADEAAMAKV